VHIPIRTVLAIYAKENGQGMFFDNVDEESETTLQKAVREQPVRPVLHLVKSTRL